MGKARDLPTPRSESDHDDRGDEIVVPMVDYSPVPAVRIYDGVNDGSYWFRRAGFTSKLTDP